MNLKLCFLLFLFICIQSSYGQNPFSNYISKYKYDQSVNEVNEELESISSSNFCSGLNLVKTCGNKKCEKNESIDNCPADCLKDEIRSYNHQTICTNVQTIFTPKNIKEVQGAINYANELGMKVRATGKLHSANGQLCTNGIIISTKNLNKISGLEFSNNEEVVNVEAGVTLGELSEWLHTKNKSLGYTLIGYRGVTVAGSTATGSHGSSPKHNAVLSSFIRSITFISADGEIKTLSKDNTSKIEWRAFKSSLGMLGFIVSMKIKVLPQFNIAMKVSYHKDKILKKDQGLLSQVKDCDWGQINWFPGAKKFMLACGNKTDAPADPGATNTLLNPDAPKFAVNPFKSVLQIGACHNKITCLLEKVRYWLFKWKPYFKKYNKSGKLVSTHELVGPSHRMTSSDFTKKANGFFQMDWEIAVPESSLNNAMKDVYEHVTNTNTCLPLVGVFIRFTKSSDSTLLAHSVAEGKYKKDKLVAFIEMPIYLPVGLTEIEKEEYHSKFENFVKILIKKHHGRAHWAKNQEWAFTLQGKEGALRKNFIKFQKVINKWDPYGVFSNNFGKTIGLNWPKANVDYTTNCSANYHPVCTKNQTKFKNICFALENGINKKEVSYKNCK